MAFRLQLVPADTKIDFFRYWKLTFGFSVMLMLVSVISVVVQGFSFGIDFNGGTSIRAESTQELHLSELRDTLEGMNFSDVAITEVFDPNFRADQHVVQIRLAAAGDDAALTSAQLVEIETALQGVDPDIRFTQAESVSGKVSGELIWTAALSLLGASAGILLYIWMRFEWQFALGAIAALIHDAVFIIGVWSVFQFKFDLTTVAAVLTIIGYSVNDTVVVFDRVRENLMKYKQMPLIELLNITLNETLSRTILTSMTTMLALIALFAFGGDVIRGFIFAMILGVLSGIYSTIYVASVVVLRLGISRDKPQREDKGPNPNDPYAHVGH